MGSPFGSVAEPAVNRRFVLDPLLDVWPDAVLPDGTPIAPYRDTVAGQHVRKVGSVWGMQAAMGMFAAVAAVAVFIWWAVGRVL